jgi:polar amino acid transport system substrate-binding protein
MLKTGVYKSAVWGMVLVLVLVLLGPLAAFAGTEEKEQTIHARVMETGIIRCGYFVWPSIFNVDANTGEKSGLFYDLVEELGKRLSLKIDWAQDLNFGTYLQDLENKKYDMECTGGWPTAERGKYVSYSKPLFYIPLVPLVRAGDTRFDDNILAANDSGVKAATIDGENSQNIRARMFPEAQEVGLPQTSSSAELMMSVAAGKADITFTDAVSATRFLEQNPSTLKIVSLSHPLKLIPQAFSIRSEEGRYENMMNIAIEEMILDGTVEVILKKYEGRQKIFVRAATPYVSAE